MNQILSMDPNNPSFGNNMGNNGGNNGGNGGKLSNKTTKRIFAIGAIIFGLVIFISGLMGIINQFFKKPQGPIINYPIITTMKVDNTLTISIENDVAIDVIQYSWNNERVQEISGDGNLVITRDIIIPEGENVLYLNVLDLNGKLTEVSETFVGEKIEDKTPPQIEVVVVSSKLNITAKSVSETKLSYLTYKWNDEEEIRLEATGNQMSIETTIDVLNGNNTLTIVAVNEKGISETRVDEYKGVKKPEIIVVKDEDGEYLEVTLKHDSGVKSAEVTLNGRNVIVTPEHFGADKKVVEFRVRLKEQTNNLKIVATSMDDSTETFNGTATK